MTQIIKYNKSKDDKERGSVNSGQVRVGNNSQSGSGSETTVENKELWEEGNAPKSLIPKGSDNITEGEQSVAIGVDTVTSNQGELAIGIYNESTPLETLFSVGNGTDSSNRSNVLEVKKNNITNIKGNVNITGTTYSGVAVDSSYIHGFNIDADNAYKLGKYDEGQWIVEKDNDKNLKVHTVLDKSLIISPQNQDMMVISSEKTKVNNLLDLTKDTTGTAVTMGTTKVEESNTNIKSVVENGFYFTDNNNNIAIGITGNYIQMGIDMGSPNFFSGLEGWRIQPDGTAEFQNLKVDGNLDVYVITYNEMRATNGILLVTDVGCITDATETVISNKNYWIFTISEFPPFAIDDYVLLQYRASETRIFQFKGIVTAIGADGENTVRVLPLSGFEGSGTSVDERGVTTFSTVDPDTAEGQYLIRIGNKTDTNRQTIIKLNPYDGGYIDFMRGLNSANKLADVDSTQGTLPTACRIGNLAGVTYKGTTLQGYGLFSDNAYLTGAIKNLNNTWSLNEDGSGQIANGHISWDASGNLSIKLGSTELTQYITNANNELKGYVDTSIGNLNSSIIKRITNTKTELKGYIDASVGGLSSSFSQAIETVTDHIYDVSTNLKTNYSTTKQMNSAINQKADSITSTVNQTIYNVSTDLNGKIDSVDTSLSSKITQTASSITSDLQSWVNTSLGSYATKSLLTQTANNLTSNIESWVNSSLGSYVTKSLLTQTSNSLTSTIESWVNSSLGSYAKKSEITQNEDSIKLAIYDDLKKTGIDINSGIITLSADNANFTGNINIYNAEEGLTIYDSVENPKIIIQNSSIGNLSDFEFGGNKWSKQIWAEKNIAKNTKSMTCSFDSYSLGSYSSGDTITLNSVECRGYSMYLQGNGYYYQGTVKPSTYSYTIKCANTTVVTKSGNVTNDANAWSKIPNYSFTLSSGGNVTIQMTITFTCSNITNAGKFEGCYNFKYSKKVTTLQRIALDGAVIAASDTQYNWFGSDLTQIRNGASAIRAYNGKLQRNSVNTNTTTFSDTWSDLSSTVPYRIVNTATYTATTDDCLIYFSTVIGNNDAQRLLYLPHPSTCPGKFYFVKNGTTNNTIAFVSGHTTEYMFVWHSATNKQYSIKFDAESEIFISCGLFWISFNCN